MKFRKVISKIHLILGLGSGLVIFIIGITGAIYCFAPELESFQPYRKVQKTSTNYLPPSRIQFIAAQKLPGKKVQRIYYYQPDKAVMVLLSKKEEYNYSIFIDPYNGDVLKVRNNDKDFLSVVLQVHRTLCIPYGHEIIRWSTVIFIFMLISGIILWWPKKRRTAKQGFSIMWKASPKRLNYDLHKVLGFYISWIVVFTALTGLMFAFTGFADMVYKITGADRSVVTKTAPSSDTTITDSRSDKAIDIIWQKIQTDFRHKYAITMFVLPASSTGAILLRGNPDNSTLYKTDFRYFDQYTGEEIEGAYVWGQYKDAHTLADNIRRTNYDMHTGAYFGLPGRVVLFFLAIVVTSLSVTGFLFWYGRKYKQKGILERKSE